MILITGGAGFIGSNFVHEWLKISSEPIIVLDALTYAGNLKSLEGLFGDTRFKFVHGDIGNSSFVDQVLEYHKPRAILNFAAESHVDRSINGPAQFIQTNIVGTFSLLESVRKYFDSLPPADQTVFRFLHVSTDEVYGSLEPTDNAFTEFHQYHPNSPYSASKAASDHLVRAWHHTYGIPTLTTNCSNNYGPYHYPEKLIPLTILNALNLKDIPVYGDGSQVRDWLYVTDHCSALRKVLEGGVPGEVYNIGGNQEKTNLEVVHTVCAILDGIKPSSKIKTYTELITHVEDRKGHDQRYAIDSTKVQTELGWQPIETFDTGIEKTVQWYLTNNKWVSSVTSGDYQHWIKTQYK